MIIATHPTSTDRLRKGGIAMAVVAAHLAAFLLMARAAPPPPMAIPLAPVLVELVRPPQPPPPPASSSATPGGGAPAAPSRIHTPPPPPVPVPPELPAPEVQAPEPALAIGVAASESPTPSLGQGGQGSGAGAGVGAGDGPGAGWSMGPRNLRRATSEDLRRYHPPEALRRRQSGVVTVSCRIRPDTRLDQCEILSESPADAGFGQAGLIAAVDLYRFRPATIDGQPDDRLRAVITLEFGRRVPPRG